ncbi:hypothetical protein PFISCL1PPCAC_14039, partial [Pristionchus fissidentatus]
ALTLSIAGMFIFIIALAHFVRWRILRSFTAPWATKNRGEATVLTQRGFINALTAESYLIIFSFYALIAFVLISEGTVENGFLECTVYLAHSIQFTLAPLFTIYFVDPLR